MTMRLCPACRGTGNGLDLVTKGCSRCDGGGRLPMVQPAGLTEAEAFFWANAGWSYMPGQETPEQGRMEGAKRLAAAEQWLKDEGGNATWEVDQVHDREECNYVCCVAVCCECGRKCCCGERSAVLGGIDAEEEDNYRRVVEAELALELMNAD